RLDLVSYDENLLTDWAGGLSLDATTARVQKIFAMRPVGIEKRLASILSAIKAVELAKFIPVASKFAERPRTSVDDLLQRSDVVALLAEPIPPTVTSASSRARTNAAARFKRHE